jgi:hypothetical protein
MGEARSKDKELQAQPQPLSSVNLTKITANTSIAF